MEHGEVRVCGTGDNLPTIYVFVNGIAFGSDLAMMALSEDGDVLAGHCSSNEQWGYHDMGMHPHDWKHEEYRKKYPEGFRLKWLGNDPTGDAGWVAALEKAKAKEGDAPSEGVGR